MDAPPPLDPAELADLEALAGAMIPASEAHGVPGADDPEILAVIAAHAAGAREALARLAASLGDGPGTLGALDRAELEARLVRSGGPEAGAVYALVLMHYYRDDRVMAALGLEPRPPFPAGHPLEDGDAALLDPVRARAPFWRPA